MRDPFPSSRHAFERRPSLSFRASLGAASLACLSRKAGERLSKAISLSSGELARMLIVRYYWQRPVAWNSASSKNPAIASRSKRDSALVSLFAKRVAYIKARLRHDKWKIQTHRTSFRIWYVYKTYLYYDKFVYVLSKSNSKSISL